MTVNRKPRVFIGSSREAIKYARAVAEQLEVAAHVNPWYAGTFGANDYTMDALDRELDNNDFGVFIFAAEDVARIRGELVFITRDNTLFEMGLFWGRLGKRRVFCLIPRTVPVASDEEGPSSFHLPSDLEGLNLLRYTDNERLVSAVDVACGKILDAIAREGLFAQRNDILAERDKVIQRKDSVLYFFWEFLKNVAIPDANQRYTAYAEAIRNSILAPLGFRSTGAALWKKIDEKYLAHVGGNVGRGKKFPLNANDGKRHEDHIIVLKVFNTGDWSFFSRREIAHVYVLCYPLSKEHVLSVHFSGNQVLDASRLQEIVAINDDLLATIRSLVGGDST
ncbi:TIR domain-containing protein [Paenibacillus whitsoniae]|uniref:Nucleotide-binding protein n=1 Tax=Paenibacillus whitsoniae TaxID=2496558 RepID=A0A430JC01_9BACL|nr:TIR domain-containing protein [Paenibacillus whitsoniae]RTE08573.1 nucleotide-binding protein [Paenibacillus whitsoniae]